MRISKIEFENFRNFKEHGVIHCSTDGKVTIVYGKNGDGKTTLHQLFQWVLYGYVHFNKTTTERLYNLQYESECSFGEEFQVLGCIDFVHDGSEYSVRRTYTYRKGLSGAEKIGEDFSLSKKDEDYNWLRLDRPKDTIEKLLPSGLSDYFFFDGESMIADLRVKGDESAKKLRKALYSMFDLDIMEAAIDHIGHKTKHTSVIGKLDLSRGGVSTSGQISAIRTNIENAHNKIATYSNDLETYRKKKAECQSLITSVSEKIGATKSKAEYEKQRKVLKNQRDMFIHNAEEAQAQFGEDVISMFPQLLISKAIQDARQKMKFKAEEKKFPSGLSKPLITYLLTQTDTCICGNPICEAEVAHIKSYLDMIYPNSFAAYYQNFTDKAQTLIQKYNKDRIEQHIVNTLRNNEQAFECDNAIDELDRLEKSSPDIENLVIARQKAEHEIRELDVTISNFETEIKKYEIYLKKQMTALEECTKNDAETAKINYKIDIMQQVATYFLTRLNNASNEYSRKLEDNIQSLINEMLTSKRKVAVSSEFAVRVTDSFNDESKSEGQFAVVSFAYIGGILKMLQSEENLASKEYPLVLDGPFSKLDPDQRQNVVNVIPKFAPQVILFSKDDLHGVFDENNIGRVWTIVSNDEKNVARIEEGLLWK